MSYNYGKDASIKLGTSEVIQCRSWNMPIAASEYEASCLGDDWEKGIPVINNWSATLEAIFDPADTNGQLALQTAALANTKITNLKLYINGTNYWSPDTTADTSAGAYIFGMRVQQARAGVAIVEFSLKGFGPIKYT